MKKYEIALKNEKEKTYTAVSWFIIGLNFLSFIYQVIVSLSTKPGYAFFAAATIAALFIFGQIMKARKRKEVDTSIYFGVIIISWVILGFYWAALINIVLLFFNIITKRKLIVCVYENDIVYPSVPKKSIKWQDLNNLLLKDGLLTIDLKNNKLMQQEIDPLGGKIDEKEFNTFCRQQLLNVGQ